MSTFFTSGEWLEFVRMCFEIGILAFVIYKILYFVRGTRGSSVLAGIVVLTIVLSLLAKFLGFSVITWLLDGFWAVIGLAVVVIFLVSCFVSTAMGTSVGTITLITPIAVALSNTSGFSTALCVGTVVGGAMFGDNLSFISDTTIAATSTQGCNMKDKFKAYKELGYETKLILDHKEIYLKD